MARAPNRRSPESPRDPDIREIAVGRILKPRGLEGEAWCEPLTDFPDRFSALDEVTVSLPSGERRPERIASSRLYGKRLAIRVAGYRTPEAIAKLREGIVLIPLDEAHPLGDDTFYVFDLVGMPVVTEDGEVLGPVTEVLSMPANDVFVVDRDGEEVLIPAVKAHVRIDREAGRIVVRDLGLSPLA